MPHKKMPKKKRRIKTMENTGAANKVRREKHAHRPKEQRDATNKNRRDSEKMARQSLTEEQRDATNKNRRGRRKMTKQSLTQEQRDATDRRRRHSVKMAKQSLTQEQRDAVNKRRRDSRAKQKQARREKGAKPASYRSAYNPVQNEEKIKVCDIGSMEYECSSCKALMFKGELYKGTLGTDATFSLCCSYGQISLPPVKPPPKELRDLLTNSERQSKAFRQNVRKFNSALALSSIGVDRGAVFQFQRAGPWVYKLNGQMYHCLGPIMPGRGQTPSFSQLYVYDGQEELGNRHKRNPDMDRDCLALLQDLMHTHNPFVHQYKQVSSSQFICYHISILFFMNASHHG
jgi:hypothetical protein